jgi:mannose-1-phosphate guanylyltransferase
VKHAVVILAGGSGSRLRPLSSDEKPKQFLDLFNGESLLQKTWARAAQLVDPENIFVSTIELYRRHCLDQLPELPPQNILIEPERRNTAPAIALCTFMVEARVGPCTVAFLPSDHYIGNEPEFIRVLRRAFAFASANEYVVAIGITPTGPNTEYGYHDLGEEIIPGVIRLRRFVEKPSRDLAETFLRAGNFTWNGGIYVWRPEVFRRELEAVAPELASITVDNYGSMHPISIDYAVMEHSSSMAAVRGDFEWSDVGSFEALERLGVKLPEGIAPY